MPERFAPDALVAYVPVIHRGYIEMFGQFSGVKSMIVMSEELLVEEDGLRKELRAISPQQAAELIRSLAIFKRVEVGNKSKLEELNNKHSRVVLPDEDISRGVANRYLGEAKIEFYSVFLRWDRQNVEGANLTNDDVLMSNDEADASLMSKAYAEAEKSPDIWRRVGAVLTGKGFEWAASNQPLTTQNTPWAEGDPRAVFKRGERIEMSTFMHAEANLIAKAAREGANLTGAALYVTTFPCPPCAMLVARSGIKKLFFSEGYAMLDGGRVLADARVEVKRVPFKPSKKPGSIPYSSKS